jgi:hypothetical protein
LGARVGGASSSFTNACRFSGPEILFPLIVGVSPGVSEEESDDGDVSAPEDEPKELLMVFFTAPDANSFRGIDLDVPPESVLDIGKEESLDSADCLSSKSSLNLDSCEDRGVPAFSAERNGFGESVLVIIMPASLRGGAADNPPPDVDRETLLSLVSDCELLLEFPAFFPFGTSPNLNLSAED